MQRWLNREYTLRSGINILCYTYTVVEAVALQLICKNTIKLRHECIHACICCDGRNAIVGSMHLVACYQLSGSPYDEVSAEFIV